MNTALLLLILSQGALAADQPASMQIGNEILAKGGDAVDAAIATALALGVENPSSSGLGGGGFAIVWRAKERRLYALDFRESAPGASNADLYLDGGKAITSLSRAGCLAAGVPGEVAGLAALHRRFGNRQWKDLVEPARALAVNGVAVSNYLAGASAAMGPSMKKFPAAASAYGGLREGGRRVDLELATTLAELATEGPEAFYHGGIASRIDAACAHVPGAVTGHDLAAYEVKWRKPVVGIFRGYQVASMPPPSSGGGVIVEVLNILEGTPELDLASVESLHVLAEAMKHAFADRHAYYGDPDFVDVPMRRLTAKSYARELRGLLDPLKTRSINEYGGPGLEGSAIRVLPDDSGTSHLSVVDKHGNAVALTTSVNGLLGSLVRVPGGGFVLNNTMDDFSLAPGVPNMFGLIQSERNAIAANKRPLSSMTPVVVLDRDGRVVWVAGASGGPLIITSTLQSTLHKLIDGLDAAEAVAKPRIHHQWLPDNLFIEPALPRPTQQSLRVLGHTTRERGGLGVVQAVGRRGDGSYEAAADSRKTIKKRP